MPLPDFSRNQITIQQALFVPEEVLDGIQENVKSTDKDITGDRMQRTEIQQIDGLDQFAALHIKKRKAGFHGHAGLFLHFHHVSSKSYDIGKTFSRPTI